MAKDTQLSEAAVNAQADAMARMLDNGYRRIYDGAKPADASVAVTTQTLLAELRFNAVSAPPAVAGQLTFNAFTPDSDAKATGDATWFRDLKADGTSAVKDGTVGTIAAGTENMNLDDVHIQQHASVSINGDTHTVPMSAPGV